jgi:integrase
MTVRHANHGLSKRCDCPRRSWPKCLHAWWLNVARAGMAYRISLDKHAGKHLALKSEAEDLAVEIKAAISDGTFGQVAPVATMTVRQLADVYLERFVAIEHPDTAGAFALTLRAVCSTVLPSPTGGEAPFGDWRLADVVTDTLERFREVRRQRTGVVGVNRLLGSLRALLNWGVLVGYLGASPFQRGTQTVVKLSREHSRSRRLQDDEATTLLAACGSHLRAVVECALATGMRRGEILSLQWKQVEGLTIEAVTIDGKVQQVVTWAPRAELVLPWAKTKTRRDRRIPISSRLRAVLAMRRFDPNGKPHPATSYVFGNEVGARVLSVGRAWRAAVLRAHSLTPKYSATKNLAPESQAALRAIGLHLHDLRREAGSRWLEGGVPLHTIRDWLGHVNISQTSTYLSGTMTTQHGAMEAFEAVEAQRAIVQVCVREVGKGGQNGVSEAEAREETPNKTGPDRRTPIM